MQTTKKGEWAREERREGGGGEQEERATNGMSMLQGGRTLEGSPVTKAREIFLLFGFHGLHDQGRSAEE